MYTIISKKITDMLYEAIKNKETGIPLKNFKRRLRIIAKRIEDRGFLLGDISYLSNSLPYLVVVAHVDTVYGTQKYTARLLVWYDGPVKVIIYDDTTIDVYTLEYKNGKLTDKMLIAKKLL